VKTHLLGVIDGAKNSDQVVLLALDEVYDEQCQVHREWTHLHTPNRFLAELTRENPRLLWGSSVHPYRSDWESELEFCLEQRAVLCKWIPSSMLIDPESPKCTPIYKKLAEHNLPLLCHAGPEYAIPTSNKIYNRFNNPKYLKTALDLGVTVILAHCALPYFDVADQPYLDDYHDFLKLLKQADDKGWKLYADLSAVASPLRARFIPQLLAEVPPERLIYGSDYPIPISEFSYNKSRGLIFWLKYMMRLFRIKNPLDKNYEIIRNMKFDEQVFFKAGELFQKIRYQ
jgi:mannonate dehydratase